LSGVVHTLKHRPNPTKIESLTPTHGTHVRKTEVFFFWWTENDGGLSTVPLVAQMRALGCRTQRVVAWLVLLGSVDGTRTEEWRPLSAYEDLGEDPPVHLLPPARERADSGASGRGGVPEEEEAAADGVAHVADVAYVTKCLKTPDPLNDFGHYAYYDQCLASICSLLGTTNPAHVLVLVDSHFPQHARRTLEAQGVQVMNTDGEVELTAWPDSAAYPASEHAAHPRLHTFRKLAIFKLLQYTNVFWFDSDTEIRSNLTDYFVTLPTDRDAVISSFHETNCNPNFNSGVMVVRPSQRVYDELLTIWRTGDFIFNFGQNADCDKRAEHAKKSLTEQDLLIEYFRRHRDRHHELDRCYNYRGSGEARALCGECGNGKCDARIKILHVAKLIKWVDMSAWQVHSWRGKPSPRLARVCSAVRLCTIPADLTRAEGMVLARHVSHGAPVPPPPSHGEHLMVHARDTALCMETSLSVQKCRI
jgi:hypothetical protein